MEIFSLLRKYLSTLKIKVSQIVFRHPHTPSPIVAMTLLTKNEGDILEKFLMFNKNSGVDFFVVTNNGSTDNTAAIIEKYQKLGWIKQVFDYNGTFDQVLLVDRMNKWIIKNSDADWVVNSDTDEFWVCTSGNLKEYLSKRTENLVRVKVYNVIPLDQSNSMSNRMYVFDPEKIDSRAFSIYSRSFPKVIYRAKDYISISQGNHDVKLFNKSICIANDIMIMHYAVRSASHLLSKFNALNSGNIDHVKHVKEYVQIKNNYSERELFELYIDNSNLEKYFSKGWVRECTAVSDFFMLNPNEN